MASTTISDYPPSISIKSWLATVIEDHCDGHDWTEDPAITLHLPQQESQQQASTTFFPQPQDINTPQSRGRKRKRGADKDAVMNSDRETYSDAASTNSAGTSRTGTITSGTTTSAAFRYRPILHPRPPSSRQRSASPTRNILSDLEFATPSVVVCQPDARVEQPDAVRRLRISLQMKLSRGVIPHALKSRLRDVDPDFGDDDDFFSNPLFEDDSIAHTQSYTDRLWDKTDEIYNLARDRCDRNSDESGWVQVIHLVLSSSHDSSSMLDVRSIQTQSIDPACLPQHPKENFARKADFALAFSLNHTEIKSSISAIHRANPGITLSQMTDAETSKVPMVCCVEVKEMGGKYQEAIIQLGVWCAAGLERLRGLRIESNGRRMADARGLRDINESDERTVPDVGEKRHFQDAEAAKEPQVDGTQDTEVMGLPPFIGWTAIGHDWSFYISWKDASENVIVLGPWISLNSSTRSHRQILVLMAMVRHVRGWLEEEYWPWLRENILDGLS